MSGTKGNVPNICTVYSRFPTGWPKSRSFSRAGGRGITDESILINWFAIDFAPGGKRVGSTDKDQWLGKISLSWIYFFKWFFEARGLLYSLTSFHHIMFVVCHIYRAIQISLYCIGLVSRVQSIVILTPTSKCRNLFGWWLLKLKANIHKCVPQMNWSSCACKTWLQWERNKRRMIQCHYELLVHLPL